MQLFMPRDAQPRDAAVPLWRAKADLFRTLGHPVRIRVLELLGDGPHTVQQLLQDVGGEPAALSQQLAVLRRAGIVVSERTGLNVTYELAGSDVADLMAAARRILRELIDERSALRELLDDEDATADRPT